MADNSTNQNTDITQAFSNQIGTINLDMGSENGINGSQMAALPVNQSGQIILTNDGQIGGKFNFNVMGNNAFSTFKMSTVVRHS